MAQQKQGRVRPNLFAKGVQINDERALEHEADIMGDRAARAHPAESATPESSRATAAAHEGRVVQRRLPPGEIIETELELSGLVSAQVTIHRLLHAEVSAGRLRRAADNQLYADTQAAMDDVFPNDKYNAVAYAALYQANRKYLEVLPSGQALRDPDWDRLEPELNPAFIESMRRAIILENLPDPFPAFDEEGQD